jgi:hypothetical protein
MKITENEPLRFAVLTDTHVSRARTAVADGMLIAGDQDGYVHGIRLT